MKEDVLNYYAFSVVGGRKRIKQGVVPHLNLNTENSGQSRKNSLSAISDISSETDDVSIKIESVEFDEMSTDCSFVSCGDSLDDTKTELNVVSNRTLFI